MSDTFLPPLSALEKQGRTHAILCTTGFLILLPIGALVGRYGRTFNKQWINVHWTIQFLIAAPVIFAGWALGYDVNAKLGLAHFFDTHGKCGLALLILYLIQLTLGVTAHAFKLPTVFHGHRAPHNYLHIMTGISIFILAAYQVHYGLYIEWPTITGNIHPVPQSAKNAWMALMIIFWVLFVLGLGLLPRQLKQEGERMHGKGSLDSVRMMQKNGTA